MGESGRERSGEYHSLWVVEHNDIYEVFCEQLAVLREELQHTNISSICPLR
jgi:hypothetical protein